MNIVFVVREYPKLSETFIRGQVEGLAARGHDVTVVSLRRPSGPCATGDGGTLTVLYAGLEGNDLRRTAAVLATVTGNMRHRDFRRLISETHEPFDLLMYDIARTGVFARADAVVVHYGDLARRFALFAGRGGIDVPMAAVFHGADIARHVPGLTPAERSVLWQGMGRALPVSGFWADRLLLLGCPGDRIMVHHMGVNTGRYRFHTRDGQGRHLRIVTVCRLVPKKGIDIAVRGVAAARRILHPGDDLRFDIFGDGPERERIGTMIRELDIDDIVRLRGSVAPDDVPGILDAADVFLLPSRTADDGDMEGIPVSLMEAMASGCGVVSTFHSGIPELVGNGYSGLLVPENDVGAVADALVRYVREPGLLAAHGANARAAVEEGFSNERLLPELERILFDMSTAS